MNQVKTRNFKKHNLVLAKEQFLADIQKDEDYIKFKKRSFSGSFSYGIVLACMNKFELNKVGDTSETLLTKHLK